MDREGSADRSAGMFLIYCYASICHSAAERIFIQAFASADGKDGRSNGSGRLSDIAFDGVAVYILAGCVCVCRFQKRMEIILTRQREAGQVYCIN